MQPSPAVLHPAPPSLPTELTVVVPCYNERANVAPMVSRLDAALAGIAWEAVFVDDDSPDGTADAVRAIVRADPRVRCLRRLGRRGLASAVIEGAMASSADYVAVIDGDLQHDETQLPTLLRALQAGADLAVGSRHVEGGDSAGLSGRWRHRVSQAGIRIAQAVLPVRLSDPMSGYSMLRRELFERLAPRLTGEGFKILLDLVLSSPGPIRVQEVPVRFHSRVAGESKLDVPIMLQFGGLLIDKELGNRVPLRFISFGLVGVGVHLLALQAAASGGLWRSRGRRSWRPWWQRWPTSFSTTPSPTAASSCAGRRCGAGWRCLSASVGWGRLPISALPGRCLARRAGGRHRR